MVSDAAFKAGGGKKTADIDCVVDAVTGGTLFGARRRGASVCGGHLLVGKANHPVDK